MGARSEARKELLNGFLSSCQDKLPQCPMERKSYTMPLGQV